MNGSFLAFALRQHRTCNLHRLSTARSGRNLHGMSLLQPAKQPSSHPTLSSKNSSHLQAPARGFLPSLPAALVLRSTTAGCAPVVLPSQKLRLGGASRSALCSCLGYSSSVSRGLDVCATFNPRGLTHRSKGRAAYRRRAPELKR